MRLFGMSCKKATLLSSKKEEGKLNWIEKIQLHSHMAICGFCHLFEKQSNIIAQEVKNVKCNHTLSEEAKNKMAEAISKEIDKT